MQADVAQDRRKWWMLGFAFLATVINYLDRQTLSVMAPVLMQQFRISATSYSHIIFAFMLAYTLMNGVSGRLLDRLGTRIGYGLTIAFWSGAELSACSFCGRTKPRIFQLLAGHWGGWQLSRRREVDRRVVSRRGALARVGHFQQRSIHRRDSRSAIACMDCAWQVDGGRHL